MRKLLLSFLTFVAVFSGCSTIHVDTDYDTKYPFETLKSYTISNDDTKGIDSLTAERIESAIHSTLQTKGYKTSVNNGDMKVAYYLTTTTITRSDSNVQFAAGVGPYRRLGWGMRIPVETTHTYDEGKLTIDIIDTKNDKLVWRGVGQDTLKSFSTPEKKTVYINQAIGDILKKFPPKH